MVKNMEERSGGTPDWQRLWLCRFVNFSLNNKKVDDFLVLLRAFYILLLVSIVLLETG
jgi:hypothetical protein